MAIDTDLYFDPPARVAQMAHIRTHKEYQQLHKKSIEDPTSFFGGKAKELLSWHRSFDSVVEGSLKDGDVRWFVNGELNASYNCVDRHAASNPDDIAIMWEGDEPGNRREITYKQLLHEVCKVANYIKSENVKRGDTVAIYMPMIPEAVFVMLACARLGVIHSVVFAGFSDEALASRIQDAQCKLLFTADQGRRGGKIIHLKQLADQSIRKCPSIKRVIVFKRTADPSVILNDTIDVYWDNVIQNQCPYTPPVPMNSEDPLFLLYTSGSTGKPKGVLHTHAGYLLQAALTTKFVFDVHRGDRFGCTADIGWITGHSYIVYGPLLLGVATLLFEGVPTWPTPSRYWQAVEYWKLTQFYTAPTAIRTLKKLGDEYVTSYNRGSLRVLGSVGEPINPEAWLWYRNVVGDGKCAVVDTYWQTETGAIVLTPLPGASRVKAGSACFPFFGVNAVILKSETGQVLNGETSIINDDCLTVDESLQFDSSTQPMKRAKVVHSDINNEQHTTDMKSHTITEGVLCIQSLWPSMARTLYGDHGRYMQTYLKPYEGYFFTGDSASCDEKGYFTILGRVDDVINVSGHRLGTAEIESALTHDPRVAEAACVAVSDEVTGQAVFAFVSLKEGSSISVDELRQLVRHVIGAFASPKHIVVVSHLPKTRSGKILRRLLRKIAQGENEIEQLGDLSTLNDPGILPSLVERVVAYFHEMKHIGK